MINGKFIMHYFQGGVSWSGFIRPSSHSMGDSQMYGSHIYCCLRLVVVVAFIYLFTYFYSFFFNIYNYFKEVQEAVIDQWKLDIPI